jgi:hypothetical protein
LTSIAAIQLVKLAGIERGESMILSMSELLVEWDISPNVLYKCVKEGLPHKKVGDIYEFDLEECQRWYREGHFNSLSKKRQEAIVREFKKGGFKVDTKRKKEDSKSA